MRQNHFAGLASDSEDLGRGMKICIDGKLPSDSKKGGGEKGGRKGKKHTKENNYRV